MTLGRALLDSGDVEAAEIEFEAVLQGAPDNLLARRFLEECQARRAEPEVAAARGEGDGQTASSSPSGSRSAPLEISFGTAAEPAPAESRDDAAPRPASARELPPIPLAAAEEHWELAEPYEVAVRPLAAEAPSVPTLDPPPVPAETPPSPAPVGVKGEAIPPPLPVSAEAVPGPRRAARGLEPRRPGVKLPDLSTLLADSPVLNASEPPPVPPPPLLSPRVPSPAAADPRAVSPPAAEPVSAELPATGSLAEYDFPDLIHSLFVRGWTGTVELHRGRIDTSVQVTGGRLVFASSTNRDERLGELLLRRDKITLPQYYDASKAIRKGKRLGTVLVEQGALEPKDLVKVVVEHTRELICSVFLWTEGFYKLKEGPDPGNESITLRLSTADIIMEGIGRVQAWSRIERGVGGPQARYVRADDYQERLQEMTLTPEKLLMVGDLGGERDVASICEASKLGDFEVCRTLWAFRVIGIVRRLDTPRTDDQESS
jgi:hypothetical protein